MDSELKKILRNSFCALCRDNKVVNVEHFLRINCHFLDTEDKIIESGWINACANDNVEILYLILHFISENNYDFNPRYKDDSAFKLALQSEHIDTLEFLISQFPYYRKEFTWPDSQNMKIRYYIIDDLNLNLSSLFETFTI